MDVAFFSSGFFYSLAGGAPKSELGLLKMLDGGADEGTIGADAPVKSDNGFYSAGG